MPSIATGLLIVANSLPAAYVDDEPKEARADRVHVIADGIDAGTRDGVSWSHGRPLLGAVVLDIWWNESRLDRRIHAGIKHPTWTSDHGEAACMGQLHESGIVPYAEWATLAGVDLESTTRCARATARVFVASYRHCHGKGGTTSRSDLAKAFAAYAGQGCNVFPWALARADETLRYYVTIRRNAR